VRNFTTNHVNVAAVTPRLWSDCPGRFDDFLSSLQTRRSWEKTVSILLLSSAIPPNLPSCDAVLSNRDSQSDFLSAGAELNVVTSHDVLIGNDRSPSLGAFRRPSPAVLSIDLIQSPYPSLRV
jgi:hypothetical protein